MSNVEPLNPLLSLPPCVSTCTECGYDAADDHAWMWQKDIGCTRCVGVDLLRRIAAVTGAGTEAQQKLDLVVSALQRVLDAERSDLRADNPTERRNASLERMDAMYAARQLMSQLRLGKKR